MARERALAVLLVALAGLARAEVGLDETRLPLRLVGTVVAARPDRSLAVIESGGATSVVRAGQTVGGARVEEIGADSVVIAHKSGRERLSFGAPSVSGPVPSGAGEVARAHGRSASSADSGRDTEPRARSAARSPTPRGRTLPRRPAARRASFAKPATNDEVIADLSKQARYQPVLDDAGKLRGVALVDILPDSALERFGLQSGDVVTHVAGVKIDNTANAYNTLRGLSLANGVDLTVLRRGVPTNVKVPSGAF